MFCTFHSATITLFTIVLLIIGTFSFAYASDNEAKVELTLRRENSRLELTSPSQTGVNTVLQNGGKVTVTCKGLHPMKSQLSVSVERRPVSIQFQSAESMIPRPDSVTSRKSLLKQDTCSIPKQKLEEFLVDYRWVQQFVQDGSMGNSGERDHARKLMSRYSDVYDRELRDILTQNDECFSGSLKIESHAALGNYLRFVANLSALSSDSSWQRGAELTVEKPDGRAKAELVVTVIVGKMDGLYDTLRWSSTPQQVYSEWEITFGPALAFCSTSEYSYQAKASGSATEQDTLLRYPRNSTAQLAKASLALTVQHNFNDLFHAGVAGGLFLDNNNVVAGYFGLAGGVTVGGRLVNLIAGLSLVRTEGSPYDSDFGDANVIYKQRGTSATEYHSQTYKLGFGLALQVALLTF